MTEAITPHSSLRVELSFRTSGGNAAMNSIPRRAPLDELDVGHARSIARRGRPLQGPDDG